MSKVSLLEVTVGNNPGAFNDSYKFTIRFEVKENLQEDMDISIRYVCCAKSSENDQILDTVLVGPLTEGLHQFVLEVPPPTPALIPVDEAVGVTVIILEFSYREKRFASVGYYLSHEYDSEELQENMPDPPQFDKLKRNIFDDTKRLTYYSIPWDNALPSKNDYENGKMECETNDSNLKTVESAKTENGNCSLQSEFA